MQRIIPSHGRCTMFKMCSAFFRVVVKIIQVKTHSPVVFLTYTDLVFFEIILKTRHGIQRYKDGGLRFTPRRSFLLDVCANRRSPFFPRPLPRLLLPGPAPCVFETFLRQLDILRHVTGKLSVVVFLSSERMHLGLSVRR